MSTPTLTPVDHDQDQAREHDPVPLRERAAAWWTRSVADPYREYQDRRWQIGQLMGNRVDELPADPDQAIDHDAANRAAAARAARPSTVTTAIAAGIFAGSAIVTAPAAAGFHPRAALETLVGHPLASPDPMTAWVLDAAASPLVSLALWLMIYASIAGDLRRILAGARHGYHLRLSRAYLAVGVLGVATITYLHLDRTVGTATAFVGVGLVLAAWRAMARATSTEAAIVARLNRDYAWTRHHRRARFPQQPA